MESILLWLDDLDDWLAPLISMLTLRHLLLSASVGCAFMVATRGASGTLLLAGLGGAVMLFAVAAAGYGSRRFLVRGAG